MLTNKENVILSTIGNLRSEDFTKTTDKERYTNYSHPSSQIQILQDSDIKKTKKGYVYKPGFSYVFLSSDGEHWSLLGTTSYDFCFDAETAIAMIDRLRNAL